VKLRELLTGGSRKRRAPRQDGPRTIVPEAEPLSRTSAPERFDAARERLRAAIPPRADDD
jgi:hypothetical protein